MAGGRPTTYNTEIASIICEQISTGMSLRSICAQDDMPAASSVFKWLIEHEEFSEQYALATEERTEAMAEDILDIADSTTEEPNRSRLRVDTRKWLMSKMKPKKYGDKLDVSSKGEKLEGLVIIQHADNQSVRLAD